MWQKSIGAVIGILYNQFWNSDLWKHGSFLYIFYPYKNHSKEPLKEIFRAWLRTVF